MGAMYSVLLHQAWDLVFSIVSRDLIARFLFGPFLKGSVYLFKLLLWLFDSTPGLNPHLYFSVDIDPQRASMSYRTGWLVVVVSTSPLVGALWSAFAVLSGPGILRKL